jgi:hypothetical protein
LKRASLCGGNGRREILFTKHKQARAAACAWYWIWVAVVAVALGIFMWVTR